MPRRLTTEQFIKKAEIIHNNKYDYSKVEYIGSKIKVCIICPIHGAFWQKPNSHLNDKGCLKCANVKIGLRFSSSQCEFIHKAKKNHHNKYDYSLVEYIHSQTKVCIICPEHGEFWMTPNCHLSNRGCLKCSGNHGSNNEEFIHKARKINDNKYDYSKVDYVNCKTKVCIICVKHGEFWQTPNNHLQGDGCPSCNESSGEKAIAKWLNKHDFEYVRQMKFDECRNIKSLPFDFYLSIHNILIEYDGIQHFKSIDFFGGEEGLKERRRLDAIKTKYCVDTENLQLIRIRYDENIDEVLSTIL